MKQRKLNRVVSLLIAAILLLGNIPMSATAASAPATITLTDCDRGGRLYQSPALGGNARLHIFRMDVDGTETPGFCYSHLKHMDKDIEGEPWSNPVKYTGNALFWMQWWMTCVEFAEWANETYPEHAGNYNDMIAALQADGYTRDYWLPATQEAMNAVVQALVWLDENGRLPAGGNEECYRIVGAEYMAVCTQLNYNPSSYAGTDGVGWARSVWQNNQGKIDLYDIYLYTYAGRNVGSEVQKLLVPMLPKSNGYEFYLTLDKVDENGDALNGATFGVYTNADGSGLITTFTNANGTAQLIKTNSARGTVYIREEAAPSGYINQHSNQLFAVEYDASINTQDNPVHVMGPGTGGVFVNMRDTDTPLEPDDPPVTPPSKTGVINKVDALDNSGVGPATFHVEGNASGGDYVSADLTTDGRGRIELQWADPSGDNYFPAGEYTVTEKIAPAGYSLSTESQHLSLRWDGVNMTQSGPIVFANNKQHEITIRKVDSNGAGLSGAIFAVSHNGSLIGTYTTNGSGEIRLNGTDGNGLQDGWYYIEEVTAPAGYMRKFLHSQSVRINSADLDITSHVMTFVNEEYPQIIIQKIRAGTTIPLPGAKFSVEIDTVNVGTFTTGIDGTIVLDYSVYGQFLDADRESWTISVKEIEAPEGYLINTKCVQNNELRKGQALSRFVFEDTEYPEIIILKTATGTNTPLAGAKFEVKVDTRTLGTFTSDENGQIVIDHATYGRYLNEDNNSWTVSVRETEAPEGYMINDTGWKTNELKKGQTLSPFVFENTKYPVIEIQKRAAGTETPLAGAKFHVRIDTRDVGDFVTDGEGKITLTYEQYGKYLRSGNTSWTVGVREIEAPDGYLLNDTEERTAELLFGQDLAPFVFFDSEYPEIVIKKVEIGTGRPLPGAKFRVAIDTADLGEFTADENGIIRIDYETYGRYLNDALHSWTVSVREIEPPEGYLLNDPNWHNAEMRKGQILAPFVFEDSKYPDIVILKLDELTDKPLAGASFHVRIDTRDVGDYVTDENGLIRITYEEYAKYLRAGNTSWTVGVREIAAPAGYLISEQGEKTDEMLLGQVLGTFVFKDSQYPEIVIHKVEVGTNAPLAGGKFEVAIDAQTIGFFSTDDNGEIRIGYDVYGRYLPETHNTWTVSVRETEPPAGYLLNDTSWHNAEMRKGQILTPFVFEDSQYPEIIILKVDRGTQMPLSGAKFSVEIDSRRMGSFVTDADGIIRISYEQYKKYLGAGKQSWTVSAKEIEAPAGYLISEPDWQTQELLLGQALTPFVFEDCAYPDIVIQKYIKGTRTPLEGARFEIEIDAQHFGTFTTDKDGRIVISYEEYEKYLGKDKNSWTVSVRELEAPAGYVLDDDQWHNQELKQGQALSVFTFTDTPMVPLYIYKTDSVTGKPLGGAVFEVRRDIGHGDETYIGTYTTDETGFAVTAPLIPDYYMVKEIKAPAGYAILQTEKRIHIRDYEYNEVNFEDVPLATLIVRKIDNNTGKPVQGAVFKVENADRMDLVGMFETDHNGEFEVFNLEAGFYIVTEMSAPEGYEMSSPASKTIKIEYGKRNYVEFRDAKKGSLKVVLQDKYSGAYLAGGEFIIIRESDQVVVYNFSTDVTGTFVTGPLTPGWYTVRQANTPENYFLGDFEIKVEVLSGKQQTVFFKDFTQGLVIEKIDAKSKATLEGARFQVKRDADGIVIGEYVTGKDGLALVSGLEEGLYTVRELVAPMGYALDAEPQTVHVREGQTGHVTFKDTKLSSITINVVDKDNGQGIPGAVVEVWQQNGELVNTYTSDATGVIMTDKIAAGYYVLKLTYVPDGYKAAGAAEATVRLDNGQETTHTFRLARTGGIKVITVDSNGAPVPGVSFNVMTLDGVLVGTYVTAEGGSCVVEADEGWYAVAIVGVPNGYMMQAGGALVEATTVQVRSGKLTEAKFILQKQYGLQIITSVKQTGARLGGVKYEVRRVSDDALVGAYTSDKDGNVFADIQPGSYKVILKEAPNGYVADKTEQVIEVNGIAPKVVEFVLSELSSIRVTVVDGTTRAPLYGVRIQVKGKNSECIREYYTNNEGWILIDKDVLNGTYSLEMISAPAGYHVDSMPRTLSVLVGATTDVVWAIYKEAGQIQVQVTSSDYNRTLDKPAGSLLQGAVFEVMNADTYQIVSSMISDANGIAASGPLPIGRYIVYQKGAAPYYGISADRKEVRLKINNDVVREYYQCPSVNLGTQINVSANTTIRAGSNMRVDIFDAKNNSDVRLDNFMLHIKVPTDAARLTTLVTPKWSHSVFYTIKYKTNMRDYQMLAANLNSTVVYQYGVSTQALALQSGEYVTDIRMEFGTVPAGFAMTTRCYLMEYILSTVYNGYKMSQRVELTGQYNAVSVSTQHIDNNPYSSSGAYVIDAAGNAGAYGGAGTAAVSGNSGQWSTASKTWTTTVTSNVKMPANLPKAGY